MGVQRSHKLQHKNVLQYWSQEVSKEERELIEIDFYSDKVIQVGNEYVAHLVMYIPNLRGREWPMYSLK